LDLLALVVLRIWKVHQSRIHQNFGFGENRSVTPSELLSP
jgi:hypothetical protein